jgi:hypothetical protein
MWKKHIPWQEQYAASDRQRTFVSNWMELSVRDKTEATRRLSWQRLKSTVISTSFHLPAKQKILN